MVQRNLIIVAGELTPNPSPTGKIALQFANLLKEDYDVSIIFMQTSLSKFAGLERNRLVYYSVFGLRLYLEILFKSAKEKSRSNAGKLFFGMLVTLMKAIGRLQSIFIFPNNLRWHFKKVYKELLKLNRVREIDYIFTFCSPFSAHLAAKKYKRQFRDVYWITYTVDPFSISQELNNVALFSGWRNRKNKKYEMEVYNEADINLVSEEVYQNQSNMFKGIHYKIFPIPYMLTKPLVESVSGIQNGRINLVYAGRFYKDIRNPEYFFKCISNIKNEKIIVHLFSTSNCEDLVDNYVQKSNGRIIKHEMIPAGDVISILMNSDILINIGNSVPEFKPSKTFEYISTGKPIISFFRNNLIDESLSNYPLSLQLNEDLLDIAESSQMIEKFCIANYGLKIEWTEIEKLYKKHTIENIKEVLSSAIRSA